MAKSKKKLKKKSSDDVFTNILTYAFLIGFPIYLVWGTYTTVKDFFINNGEPTTIEKAEGIFEEGKVWTVNTVPNTRLQSNHNHVSNPDNIINQAYVDSLNNLLTPVRDMADIFIVALNQINSPTIFDFSHTLFNYWGIGDAKKDNGILVTMTMKPHAVFILTGNGMEGPVPDAICKRIIENDIKPYFKEDKYGQGLYEAAKHLVKVIEEDPYATGTPSGIANIGTEASFQNTSGDSEDIGFWEGFVALIDCWYLFISPLIAIGFICMHLYRIIRTKRQAKEETDINKRPFLLANELKPKAMDAIIACAMPLTLLTYLPMWFMYKRNRTKVRICPHCQTKMVRLSEKEEDQYMTDLQILEEREKVNDYDVWLCKNCHHTIIGVFKNNRYDKYEDCDYCKSHLAKQISAKTELEATYDHKGWKTITYKCLYCGHLQHHSVTIPKLERSSDDSSSSSYSSGGGGSFSGGSSSGGGAGGSW